jgi:hypothetical protein
MQEKFERLVALDVTLRRQIAAALTQIVATSPGESTPIHVRKAVRRHHDLNRRLSIVERGLQIVRYDQPLRRFTIARYATSLHDGGLLLR